MKTKKMTFILICLLISILPLSILGQIDAKVQDDINK